jgi:hypothetical protein
MTEGVGDEPLEDESRAPSGCYPSGPNESPFAHPKDRLELVDSQPQVGEPQALTFF